MIDSSIDPVPDADRVPAVPLPAQPLPDGSSRRLVSVVVPAFNEERSLKELVTRLAKVADSLAGAYDWEFIIVDDGSTDGTLAVARKLLEREPRLRIVQLRRNYGQTAALQAGFDTAAGEIVISLDADLQHFPEDIPAFLDRIAGGADVVCGWRRERREGPVRRWPSRVANMLLRRISGIAIHDMGTTFRAYRREILDDVQLLGENHRFVPIFARMAGARIVELPIANISRPHGRSNYGLRRTLNVSVDLFFLIFMVRYLDRPLRPFGKLAMLLFGMATVIALALAWVWLDTGRAVVREHSGWFVSALFLYISGLQILLAGIIAEILVRIYFSRDGQRSYRVRRIWSASGDVRPAS